MLTPGRRFARRVGAVFLIAVVRPHGAQAQRARAPVPPALAQALGRIEPAAMDAHIRFLADDLLEGRGTGSRGGELAARYVAGQFAIMGLLPAGVEGSFFQWIPLVGVTSQVSLVIGAQQRTLVLQPDADFVAWPERPDSVVTLDADVVFAGYGIAAPEWDWDDYKGSAQTGRIVMVLAGDPGNRDPTVFQGDRLTAYGLLPYKRDQAARMGAVGLLVVFDSATASLPWMAIRDAWSGEQFMLDRPPQQSLRFAAWITSAAAKRMVEATGKDYELMVGRAHARTFRPVDVGARAAIDMQSRVRRTRAANVIARLPGSDSLRQHDAVVVVAHYDHRGIGPAEERDSIYNGAVDNASGVGALLATAAAMAHADSAPSRSVIFLASAATEPGLLGARAYAAQPSVPLARTAAVLNIDGANLWGPTRDIVAIGGAWSSLDSSLSASARAESLTTSADPNPGFGWFYRTDQFPLAQAGVPGLLLRPGTSYVGKPAGWGLERQQVYLTEHYHRPSDELARDFDLGGAVQQARVLLRLIWRLAEEPGLPTWHPGSEFRSAGQRMRPPR